MKAGSVSVHNRFPVGRVVGWLIFVAILALLFTGALNVIGRLSAEDDAKTLAVQIANQAAAPQSYIGTPQTAYAKAAEDAKAQGAYIPIETFFINPDRSVSFTYIKNLPTPIWSQVPVLKGFTNVTVDVRGNVSAY